VLYVLSMKGCVIKLFPVPFTLLWGPTNMEYAQTAPY